MLMFSMYLKLGNFMLPKLSEEIHVGYPQDFFAKSNLKGARNIFVKHMKIYFENEKLFYRYAALFCPCTTFDLSLWSHDQKIFIGKYSFFFFLPGVSCGSEKSKLCKFFSLVPVRFACLRTM
jgi:hypothetical protein